MIKTLDSKQLKGTIHIPSSKSDCQRALLAASLSAGFSILYNVGSSNDEKSMLSFIKSIGAKVEFSSDNSLKIHGLQITDLDTNKNEFNIGESGLGLRLITSVLSVIKQDFQSLVIKGEGSLRNRPLTFFNKHLSEMGVEFRAESALLPISISGKLVGGNYTVDGSQSSQYISGLLMALPLCKEDSILKVVNLKSEPYVQMTLHTLSEFGIKIHQLDAESFLIPGLQEYKSCSYTIESDWSSASYWIVASALGCDLQLKGLSSSSLQADMQILDALSSSNVKIINDDGFRFDGSQRVCFEFDATNCPDLFPALTTLAALTKGISKIKGIHRLIHKESNRTKALITEFSKLGVEIYANTEDELVIQGKEMLKSTQVDSHNDHRIAMCLAIASVFSEGVMTINNAESVNKSYPEFWSHFESIS